MPRYGQPPDFTRRVDRISRQVASQGTAARNQATSIMAGRTTIRSSDGAEVVMSYGVVDDDGSTRGMVVAPGGTFRLVGGVFEQLSDDGSPVVYAGPRDIPDGSGRSNRVFELRRDDDSTAALRLGDYGVAPGHDHHQALTWHDRAGNVVFADDTTSGSGLANPHIPIPTGCGDTDTSRWPHTSATSWTAVWSQYVERQNPRLLWRAYLYAPAGVTAQWQLRYAGTQLGTVQTVNGGAAGNFATWTDIAAVTDLVDYGDSALLEVRSQVTAGAGDAKFSWLQLTGYQS